MTRSLAAIVLAVLGLAAAGIAPALAEKKAGFPERSFEAGDVQQGSSFEHEFVVKNDGDEPLTVLEVHPTCGCTILDYPTGAIAPGGEGKIHFKIDTKTLGTGKQSKTITVLTDAPNAERTVLQMKFNVVTAIEFLPRSQVYLYSTRGESKQERILVRPHVDGLQVLGVSSSNPLVKVTLEPATAATGNAAPRSGVRAILSEQPGDYWVIVELTADAPVGTHKAEVAVKTSDPAVTAGSALRVVATVKDPAAGRAGNAS